MANSRYDDRRSDRSQRGGSRDEDARNWQGEGRGPQQQGDWSGNPERRGYEEQRGYDERAAGMDPQRARQPEDSFVAGFGYGGGMASGGLGYGAGVSGTEGWRENEYRADASRGGYARGNERGVMARAGDEIASWFGDEDAARRRDQDHRGKGPRGYQRSDERIREDVSDRLSDDPRLDASDIELTVEGGEVTLSGEVASRYAKRYAEDCADAVSGVSHVQNNLRVKRSGTDSTGGAGSQI
ncbi:MAG: BON domain-containing protein [Pseudotabrizicola sp.]|uniref:BON domain-containing protein n=1 Tax=Pseudotabrizicola sp. TaxID=2939647 RepID=UPI00271F9CB5|nr:BON domain-containing protein [Pseudotabrizicola sp.]MDO9638414.1 BON domain-containing protein [Pseudotabrizicola sp.]